MTQPALSFDLTPPTATRPRVNVRQVSIQQYAHGRLIFKGREAEVLRWLAAWWNRFQDAPTAGELSLWWRGTAKLLRSTVREVHELYVRRGLSDLQGHGVIEAVPNGERQCRIGGRKCCTWRVIPVGRT